MSRLIDGTGIGVGLGPAHHYSSGHSPVFLSRSSLAFLSSRLLGHSQQVSAESTNARLAFARVLVAAPLPSKSPISALAACTISMDD